MCIRDRGNSTYPYAQEGIYQPANKDQYTLQISDVYGIKANLDVYKRQPSISTKGVDIVVYNLVKDLMNGVLDSRYSNS